MCDPRRSVGLLRIAMMYILYNHQVRVGGRTPQSESEEQLRSGTPEELAEMAEVSELSGDKCKILSYCSPTPMFRPVY
jgi:hypothetical protein